MLGKMVNLTQIALENYKFFESKPGSDHIATFSSQLNLLDLLAEIKCDSVLDYGSGIGTLTKLVHVLGIKKIYNYERSEWCKFQAQANLRPFLPVYISELSLLPQVEAILIDDEISRKQISQLLRLPRIKVIFIEGWRNKTASQISHRLPFHGYSAKFVRGNTRIDPERKSSSKHQPDEKAGCWFILEKQSKILAGLSWLARIRNTGEFKELIKEFYFWFARTIRLRSRWRS